MFPRPSVRRSGIGVNMDSVSTERLTPWSHGEGDSPPYERPIFSLSVDTLSMSDMALADPRRGSL